LLIKLNLKNLEKKSINYLIKQAEDKLKNNSLSDKEKYVASYKIESLKELI